MVQNPPEDHNVITPYLLYEDAAAAIEYISRTFGLSEIAVHKTDDGRVEHARMGYRGETIMLGQPPAFENPAKSGGSPVLIHIYVDDVDAHYEAAKAAGAKITEEISTKPYGDRSYAAEDPEGHQWYFAQHVEDVE